MGNRPSYLGNVHFLYRKSKFSLFFILFGLGLFALAGCAGGEKQLSVKGKITIGDAPLTKGTVAFFPDKAKGNTVKGVAGGNIDAQGYYELFTDKKPGAPLGSYKVVVAAESEPSDAKNPYSTRKSLVNEKYTKPDTTPLTIEVKESAPAGHYDLKLEK